MTAATTARQIERGAEELEGKARDAVRKANPWIERLGRIGLLAKGIVYLIVGALAIQAALGTGGEVTDPGGAMRAILRQPFGAVMLAILAGGLLAYTAWRVVQAVANPEREPHDWGGFSKRAFRLGSGIAYGAMGVAALKLLVGFQTDDRKPSDWTRWVMGQPLGKWLVVAAGLAIAAYGVARIVKAWKGELKKQLVLDRYAAAAREWILWIGRIGQGARGIVFVVMGGYAVVAGWHTNPEEAKGVGQALRAIERAPYGPYLLAAVAAGLIAYGLFQLVEARYRRIYAA